MRNSVLRMAESDVVRVKVSLHENPKRTQVAAHRCVALEAPEGNEWFDCKMAVQMSHRYAVVLVVYCVFAVCALCVCCVCLCVLCVYCVCCVCCVCTVCVLCVHFVCASVCVLCVYCVCAVCELCVCSVSVFE